MNGHRFSHANCGSEKTFNQKGLVPGCKIEVSLHGDVIVCVDGKVEEEPIIEEDPITEEEPVIEDEPTIEDEPVIEDEPYVTEQDINQSQEPETEPEPTPQPKPKRKCNYTQVGDPKLREKDTEEDHGNGSAVKKIVAGGLAVLMAMAMGVVGFALIGAAVFFMPMLGGMNE